MPRAKVPAGQQLEALLLQRLDLPRRELELLRDIADRQAERRARPRQLFADAVSADAASAGVDLLSHTRRAAAAGIRARPAKRRRSWFA